MTHPPLVSVVIPAFRQARFASQAAHSAASQTLEGVEVIVVDDASGEDTVGQYDFPDGVRLVRLATRSGPSAARNAGLREARGRYVAFLDQDDIWLPDKLAAQFSLLESHPAAGLTYCHVLYVDECLTPTARQGTFRAVTGEDIGDVVSHWFIKTCSTVMARRELLERLGGMNEDLWIVGDWDLWTRVSLQCPVLPDPEQRVLYRTHTQQLTGMRVRGWEETTAFQGRWLEWARTERPDIAATIAHALARGLHRYSDELLWREHRPLDAARALARAIRLSPRDLRSYTRYVRIATAPLNPRFYRPRG